MKCNSLSNGHFFHIHTNCVNYIIQVRWWNWKQHSSVFSKHLITMDKITNVIPSHLLPSQDPSDRTFASAVCHNHHDNTIKKVVSLKIKSSTVLYHTEWWVVTDISNECIAAYEMSITLCHWMLRNIPDDVNRQQPHCENLKSCTEELNF